MSSAKAVRERLKKAEEQRMKDIFDECDKKGLEKRFADAFYYRITESPLAQTKSMIENVRRNGKFSEESENNLKSWKTYLEIMLEQSPNHKNAKEWKDSIALILKC